jgi:Cof subfamily protein (haloacid dehalogenase superfamily)
MELQKEKVKILVIDLDGTTLGANAVLTERTRNALCGCIEKGLRIIIATGRSLEASEVYRTAIGARGPMVYYNGSIVMDMPSRRVIERHYIGQEVITACVDIAHTENTHFHIFLCKKTGSFSEFLMAEKSSDATAAYSERTGISFSYGDMCSVLLEDDSNYCVKGIFTGEEEKLRHIRRLVTEKLRDKVCVTMSAEYILEILAVGVSKGAGMRTALEFYGLTPADAIAFGDEENDISMLSMAGYSVSPSNARPSTREHSDFIIGSNTADGLAIFLEKTFL